MYFIGIVDEGFMLGQIRMYDHDHPYCKSKILWGDFLLLLNIKDDDFSEYVFLFLNKPYFTFRTPLKNAYITLLSS